jgi:5-methylcytosine-specific restriction endonuclease McrA
MSGFSLRHVESHVLLRDLAALAAQDRSTTAALLAHIGEVNARRLYAESGCSSMVQYCVEVLRFSEDMAKKRIRAARFARRYPRILPAIADGRLHLTGVVLLSWYLLPGNADDLLTAAENKTKHEIELLIAERFPRADLEAWVEPLAQPSPESVFQLGGVPEPLSVQQSSSADGGVSGDVAASESTGAGPTIAPTAGTFVPEMKAAPPRFPRVTPLSPGRHGVQFTISDAINDKLERAKNLLSRVVDPSDLEALFDRALDALIEKTERRKFAQTDQPRRSGATTSVRTIPASVKRKVHARDGNRCTFVSDTGRRCDKRDDVEIDHITPVARGGKSTVANLRLRCRAHNQLEAERAFGAGFMQAKRDLAQGVHEGVRDVRSSSHPRDASPGS